MLLRYASVLAVMVAAVLGDVYFHNVRGSNNRLNEQSAERTNANRLFDSQVCILKPGLMCALNVGYSTYTV